jgi:hypothetical protein
VRAENTVPKESNKSSKTPTKHKKKQKHQTNKTSEKERMNETITATTTLYDNNLRPLQYTTVILYLITLAFVLVFRRSQTGRTKTKTTIPLNMELKPSAAEIDRFNSKLTDAEKEKQTSKDGVKGHLMSRGGLPVYKVVLAELVVVLAFYLFTAATNTRVNHHMDIRWIIQGLSGALILPTLAALANVRQLSVLVLLSVSNLGSCGLLFFVVEAVKTQTKGALLAEWAAYGVWMWAAWWVIYSGLGYGWILARHEKKAKRNEKEKENHKEKQKQKQEQEQEQKEPPDWLLLSLFFSFLSSVLSWMSLLFYVVFSFSFTVHYASFLETAVIFLDWMRDLGFAVPITFGIHKPQSWVPVF